jgi:hypothetical protein
VLGGVALSIDLDHPRAVEPPGPAQQVDPVFGEPLLLAGVGVIGDHEVAPGERLLDVDLGLPRRLTRAVDRLARPQQRLRGDARPVGALSSYEFALHDRHAQAALRESTGAVLARRSSAEDDHVIVTVHLGSSSSVRSGATGRDHSRVSAFRQCDRAAIALRKGPLYGACSVAGPGASSTPSSQLSTAAATSCQSGATMCRCGRPSNSR